MMTSAIRWIKKHMEDWRAMDADQPSDIAIITDTYTQEMYDEDLAWRQSFDEERLRCLRETPGGMGAQ